MAERFRHEDISAVPRGWKVRTVKHDGHRVRVAFPPGRRKTGSGRLVSILHPKGENPCVLRSSNPAELMIMGANPPRSRNAEAREQREIAKHQIRIAKQTLKMPDQIAGAIGGMSKERAREILHQHGIKFKENSTNPRPRLTREQKDYWLGQKDYWENVEGATTAKSKRYAWEDLYKKWPELRHKPTSNPRVEVVHSENPPVESIVEEFTGAPAEWIDVYNEPHMPRGRYAQLGPLIALYIKPAGGGQVRRIGAPENRNVAWENYWLGDPPKIVTDQTARKIYFVGGNQDLTEYVEAFGPRDCGNGLVELGQCRRIDYEGRKEHVADPDEDQWKHDHGEENGVLPTVLFDTKNKRLLYEGGDYRIDGAWIRN
jgi:hypothetical protein